MTIYPTNSSNCVFLKAEEGHTLVDMRNNRHYSEVLCSESDQRFFIEELIIINE